MKSALLETVKSPWGGRGYSNSRTGVPEEGMPELGFHEVGVQQGRTGGKGRLDKGRGSNGQTGKLGQGRAESRLQVAESRLPEKNAN